MFTLGKTWIFNLIIGLSLVIYGHALNEPNCKKVIIGSRSGVISSPRGLTGSICVYYQFYVEKADTITISFDHINLGMEESCEYTRLKIGPIERTICGQSSPPYIAKVRYNQAWMYFQTDDATTNSFKLHYLVGNLPELGACKEGESRCRNGKCILQSWWCNGQYECVDHSDEDHCIADITTTARPWEPIFQVPECRKGGTHIHDKYGIIHSPRFPHQYLPNLDCSWTITNYNSKKIQLRFHFFHLQSEKGTDYVSVYDGLSRDSPLIGTYYGRNVPPPIIESTLNQLYVVFHSDSLYSEIGFNATYQQKGECMPDQYRCRNELDCYYFSQRCDGYWDCPELGSDEISCQGCDDKYSCGKTPKCYSEAERCNGMGFCLNNADELNCTAKRCGPQNGLFLCRNKRCIHESWECDRTSDCDDNSDEEGCPSPFFTRRVIVAAVAGSLICSLLLVIALGCICKVYALRMHEQCGPRHESPLTRLQAEIFRRRAPPPPYHEAMLTSRPYEEARREYLNQTRDQRRRRASDRRRNRALPPTPEEPTMQHLSNDSDQGGGNDVQLLSMNTTNEQNVTDSSSTTHLIPPTTSSDSEGPGESDGDTTCIDDAGDDGDDADSVLLDLSEGIGGSASWRSRLTSDEEQSPSHAPSDAGCDSIDSASANLSVDDMSLALHETLDKENGVVAEIVDKDVATPFTSSSSTPVPVESGTTEGQMKNQ